MREFLTGAQVIVLVVVDRQFVCCVCPQVECNSKDKRDGKNMQEGACEFVHGYE
jgi:hypothetical protein